MNPKEKEEFARKVAMGRALLADGSITRTLAGINKRLKEKASEISESVTVADELVISAIEEVSEKILSKDQITEQDNHLLAELQKVEDQITLKK